MIAVASPTRPALRYFGGKWRLGEWIIGHFPEHTCYVEPYAGGSSVLLQKPPIDFEVLNDLDRRIVTFFRVMRDRPDELIDAIALTPYSRVEFDAAMDETTDELEQARRVYIRCWQGQYSAVRRRRTGWRWDGPHPGNRNAKQVKLWNRVDDLWSVVERLKNVQLDCDEALAVIRRYDGPNTLFYLDPPYVADARSKDWQNAYAFEMTVDDHRALAETLRSLKGMAIISGYPSDLYGELFAGWRQESTTAVSHAHKITTECIWISPNAAARARQMRLGMDE